MKDTLSWWRVPRLYLGAHERTNEGRNGEGNEAAAAFHVHDNEENCAEL